MSEPPHNAEKAWCPGSGKHADVSISVALGYRYPPRQKCPECGKSTAIRSEGRLWKHRANRPASSQEVDRG